MTVFENLRIRAALGETDAREILTRCRMAWSEPLVPITQAIAEYLERGWSIVPQLPGAKMPLVKWKEFQERRPTLAEWNGWIERWPDAGIAVVLGPVSNLVAVDCDGEAAYRALIDVIGTIPEAPMAVSGSGAPYKFHLYFRDPGIATKAKFTPWQENLEFRGNRGIIVLPPSLHRSGNRYAWVRGRSPAQIALPDVPDSILEALQQTQIGTCLGQVSASNCQPANLRQINLIPGISDATRAFLQGLFANGPGWNQRLFNAACDLAGNGIPLEQAIAMLLAGAHPWNSEETENAIRTIQSAFSQVRTPARRWVARQLAWGAKPRDVGGIHGVVSIPQHDSEK